MGSQRVGHDQMTNTFTFYHIWRGLQVSRTQMKMTLFTNLRSFSHFNKQWGVIQRLQTGNLQRSFQKSFSKKELKETQTRGREKCGLLDSKNCSIAISSFL